MTEPNNPYQPPRGPLHKQPRHRLAAADSSSVAGAFGFTLVAHAVYVFGGGAIALAFASPGKLSELNAIIPGIFIGVGQLLYMVPMFVLARRRGRFAFAKGLVICAAITGGLNAACFGLLAVG